jgi:PhzF family phenazine biosynthesis protein
MKLSFTTLDVFTNVPFSGNPLAIVHVPTSLRDSLSQAQKLQIAKEFNLSETVFLHETPKDAEEVPIDIFTIVDEIPFGGHPTIGTAYHLLSQRNRPNLKALLTKAGRIAIEAGEVIDIEGVEAEIPHNVHVHSVTVQTSHSDVPSPVVSIVKGVTFTLVELPDVAALGKVSGPVSLETSSLDTEWDAGLLGTYYYVKFEAAHNVQQLRTRMFAFGIEDPATGAAASALCSYLAIQEGGNFFQITQGVEMGRDSEIGVEVTTTEDGKGVSKVVLTGVATEVMTGSLFI